MPVRFAAYTAILLSCCSPAWARSHGTLTLDVAFQRALEHHPELARFAPLSDAASAQLEAESQRAPLRMGLELENAPRSDQATAFATAEVTLSLASVIETGGKRAARRAVGQARLDALTLELEQRRADLLAEVARRYLDLLAAQSLAEAAAAELAQRELMVDAAGRRVRAGAAPESVRLTAEAGAARAKLLRERAAAQRDAAARRLAILWNAREPDFDQAGGDPLVLADIPPLDRLHDLLSGSPELRRFADESRLREARLQLARSAGALDIEWHAGVRRLEEDGSWAAVAGVSVPLGSARRAAPGIRAAQAELAALSLEREAEALSLDATLIEAHLRYSSARAEVHAARDVLLPKLDAAERASERAFRAGALTHLEWSQARTENFAARREQLLAAVEAHRALIEIQRLTGTPFIAGTQP
jgi:cobalt-zinc-cadmium efflux system outer membrane protein